MRSERSQPAVTELVQVVAEPVHRGAVLGDHPSTTVRSRLASVDEPSAQCGVGFHRLDAQVPGGDPLSSEGGQQLLAEEEGVRLPSDGSFVTRTFPETKRSAFCSRASSAVSSTGSISRTTTSRSMFRQAAASAQEAVAAYEAARRSGSDDWAFGDEAGPGPILRSPGPHSERSRGPLKRWSRCSTFHRISGSPASSAAWRGSKSRFGRRSTWAALP